MNKDSNLGKEIHLDKRTDSPLQGNIAISASKSESNRLLLINALANEKLDLSNLSQARDTQTMNTILSTKPAIWDVKDAGTTMRFLTAYLGLYGVDQVITGTERMKQRPIGALANALGLLGVDIAYQEAEGYPPMRINRLTAQKTEKIQIPGNISSQYISALLMIAPCLPSGLTIELTTEVFSRPYIEMTLSLMGMYGVKHSWDGQVITVPPQKYRATVTSYTIESDWSGASYWYSFMALNSNGGNLFLPGLRKDSFQGDQAIAAIAAKMGVKSTFEETGVLLTQQENFEREVELDFKKCPDLAQTVFVIAAVKGIQLRMTGLESLKIKETDRILAMQTELAKIGAELTENGDTWTLTPTKSLPDSVVIETYEDHRMAMAFAPLSCLIDVTILDPSVVNKSYPNFWEEVRSL